MLYLKLSSGRHMIVLEPVNLDLLREGDPVVTPDREVIVACSPDVPWLAEQVQQVQTSELTVERFVELFRQSMRRPEVPLRRPHEPVAKVPGGTTDSRHG